MDFFVGLGVGLLAGGAVAAWAARLAVRRSIARARAAERRARAAEHMAEIGAMTGGLAHEIKNPLSTIGLNAQLLREAAADLPIDDVERSSLTRRTDALTRETERLSHILQDFLEFAGELRLHRERADLNVIADELAEFFAPQAEHRGVRLRVELAPGPVEAWLDVSLVKQAALNLMLNALQAIEGMAIDAEDRASKGAPEIILRTSLGRDHEGVEAAVLHVIDTGPGMDAATGARIFQPYFTTKSGGTGLGLPTTRRIVQAHGGKVELHSERGRGTDFTLSFPVEPAVDEAG